jgi:hypothetical protein
MKVNKNVNNVLRITRISLLSVGVAIMSNQPLLPDVEACVACSRSGGSCPSTATGYVSCNVTAGGCKAGGKQCWVV